MTHALKYPGRALANVPTALDRSVWLVGTTSLREQNEVCLVEYDYADERVILQDTFVHPREVWDISSSEQDDSLFCTLHGSGSGQGVTVWRREEGVRQLSAQAEVPALQSRGWRAQWHPEEKQIVVVEDVAVTVWDVQELGSGKVPWRRGCGRCWVGATQREPAAEVAAEDERASFCAASVQPSAPAVLAAAAGRAVVLADTRAAHGPAQQLALHELPVRDVAFSASHPHLLLSGGEDGQLLVLDLRQGSGGENAPGQVAKLQAHRHWVWRAAFNPQHPELVASVSSDASVCLWRVPAFGGADDSTASPSRRDATETTGAKAAAVFERHEDSVYGVSWSAADPWVLASVSYDSQVAAHAVPSNLKYEILI